MNEYVFDGEDDEDDELDDIEFFTCDCRRVIRYCLDLIAFIVQCRTQTS
jgi:hypothetical protein